MWQTHLPIPKEALLWAMLPLGLFIYWLGRRGKRLDDHPHCRKCGFNLFGKPETKTCPECGRDLSKRWAIRRGLRKRLHYVMAAGVFYILLGAATGGFAGWQWAASYDWIRIKPLSWLIEDAERADDAIASPALDEMLRRQKEGLLSDASVQTIIEAVLRLQRDRKKPWRGAWGALICKARTSKQTSDAQWKRFANQAIDLGIRVRSRINAGDPILFEFVHRQPIRLTLNGAPSWELFQSATRRVNITPVGSDVLVQSFTFPAERSDWLERDVIYMKWPIVLLGADDKGRVLSPGKYTITVTVEPVFEEMPGPLTSYHPSTIFYAFAADRAVLTARFEVFPRTKPLVKLAIKEREPFGYMVSNAFRHPGGERVRVSLLEESFPLPISGIIHARVGEEWVAVKPVFVEAGGYFGDFNVDIPVSQETVDIEIRPDPAPAKQTIDIYTIWGKPIRFDKVPIDVDKDITIEVEDE